MITWMTMQLYQIMFASQIADSALWTLRAFGFIELFIEVAGLIYGIIVLFAYLFGENT